MAGYLITVDQSTMTRVLVDAEVAPRSSWLQSKN